MSRHTMVRSLAYGLLTLVGISLLPSWAGVPTAPLPDQAIDGPGRAGTVDYRLEWSWGRAVVGGRGDDGWTVTNNRGYEVHIRSGYLVNYSAELLESPPPATRPSTANAWLEYLSPRAAYAGHVIGTPNPAAVKQSLVESLAVPAASDLGSATLTRQRYQRVYYLIARAGDTARSMPSDVDMKGSSLYLSGEYRRSRESAWTAFTVKTSFAHGVTHLLFPEGAFNDHNRAVELNIGPASAVVVITRELGSLFDDIEFVSVTDRKMAWQVLKNLIASTSIEVRQGD